MHVVYTFGVHSVENFLLSFTAKNRNLLALKVSHNPLNLRGGGLQRMHSKVARVGDTSMLHP